jgi:APA family basic amino acid/polyamine antiporter
MRALFKKKDIKECLHCENAEQKLKRSLGSFNLIIMGIGAIIGAGIFIVTGIASATSGPSLIISFIIAALACGLTALCYAEMASIISVTGGIYTYTQVTIGEIGAWIIGWVGILQYIIAGSSVAIGWSSYVVGFLASMGIVIPTMLTSSPLSGNGIINLPAFLIIIALSVVLIRGTQESARLNAFFVFIKLAVILLFIVVGFNFINPANYHPFAPHGIPGIFQGAAMVFFAYIGFDTIASAAEETKNPQRSLPIGIIGSLIICSLIYIVVTGVMNGMVNFSMFAHSDAPIMMALQSVGANWVTTIVTIGAIAGLTTVILVNLFVVPRLIFAMSRDKLLPNRLSKVHSKFQSPVISILIVGIISAFVSGFFPLGDIFELVNIAALSAFIFLAISILYLRKSHPDIPRKFRCPLVPAIPIASIIACVALISQLTTLTIELFAIWLIMGLVVYFVYRNYKNSKKHEESEIEFDELDDAVVRSAVIPENDSAK